LTSTFTIPAQLVTDENNRLFAEVASALSCSGCHKAGCQAEGRRFPVTTSVSEGPVAVDIKVSDFGLLLVNSLGLPLIGLLIGAGLGRFWGVHEGLQFGLAIAGLGLGVVSCRAYAQSMIRISSRKEAPCTL